eukprot:sb/3468742/
MSYADQSGECKDLEKALETMHRLYKSTNEELDNVKGEIKVYETGMGDMLSDLKKSHSVVEATENKRRQSEALTQSTKSKLDKTEAVVAQLHRETEQAERVINMKEDVIRFFDVVDELERKDELLVQLMSENLTRDTATIQDMDDQLATLQVTIIYLTFRLTGLVNLLVYLKILIAEKVRKLTNDRMKMEDSMEEKDLVISHLVNVINRYAYNDRYTWIILPSKRPQRQAVSLYTVTPETADRSASVKPKL